MKIGCFNSPFSSPPPSQDPATRDTHLSHKLFISLKPISFIMKTRVETTEFQKDNRCIQSENSRSHLSLGMMSFKFRCSRIKTSKPHFCLADTTAGDPGDFRHFSWSHYESYTTQPGQICCLGEAPKHVYPTAKYSATLLTGALLQNCKGRASKFF